jgi:hypothetical protein
MRLNCKLPPAWRISAAPLQAPERPRQAAQEAKEALNKSSVSALLVKRDDHKARDTGRSRDYDAKERNKMAPQSAARGAREAGIGQRRGCQTAPRCGWGANSPLRGRTFLRKKLLRPARSRPILPQPRGDGALRAVCLVRLLAKGINHSRRRLSRIPSRKATVAPAETCSGLPQKTISDPYLLKAHARYGFLLLCCTSRLVVHHARRIRGSRQSDECALQQCLYGRLVSHRPLAPFQAQGYPQHIRPLVRA